MLKAFANSSLKDWRREIITGRRLSPEVRQPFGVSHGKFNILLNLKRVAPAQEFAPVNLSHQAALANDFQFAVPDFLRKRWLAD